MDFFSPLGLFAESSGCPSIKLQYNIFKHPFTCLLKTPYVKVLGHSKCHFQAAFCGGLLKGTYFMSSLFDYNEENIVQ